MQKCSGMLISFVLWVMFKLQNFILLVKNFYLTLYVPDTRPICMLYIMMSLLITTFKATAVEWSLLFKAHSQWYIIYLLK